MKTSSAYEAVSKKTEPVKILIVEDQEVLRLGLKLSFIDEKDLLIVGEATDGLMAIDLAEKLSPDLVLMDINLPKLDGIEATREIKARTSCKVLILSGHNEDECLYPSLESGADGYCLKDISKDTLTTAIKAVAKGATWLDESIARRVLKSAKPAQNIVDEDTKLFSTLERSILSLLLEGKSADIISSELKLTMPRVYDLTRSVLIKASEKGNSETTSSSSQTESNPRRITFEHELTKRCSKCYIKLPLSAEFCPDDGGSVEFDVLIGSTYADRYEILSLLGAGNGGSVYKARHKFMGNFVAIKILHSDHMSQIELLQRFRQEAATVSHLKHPNIVSVLDFGLSDSGNAFMIMDYTESQNLDEIIEIEDQINPYVAVDIVKQICLGMQEAHSKGVLHRDLKPSNILVANYKNKNMRVLVADFGTAKILARANVGSARNVVTQKGQLFGTPLFMSPEQCQGKEVSEASDIYSLGCLMYYALTGIPPIMGEDFVDVMYKHVNCPPISLSEIQVNEPIPVLLQGIVMKALRKEPDKRYRSMEEIITYLDGIPVME